MGKEGIVSLGGLEKQGRRAIRRRWGICCKHIQHWLSSHELWDPVLLEPQHYGDLAQRLDECRAAVTCDTSSDYSQKENGWRTWVTKYLLPLARELGIWQAVYQHDWEQNFKECWSHGLFDKPRSNNKPLRLKRPDYQTCLHETLSVFQECTSPYARTTTLVERGLCTDASLATSVVRRLGGTDEAAALATWDVLYSAVADNPIHLLRFSSYPCVAELLLVQRYVNVIQRMTDQAEQVVAKLRIIVIALYRSVTAPRIIQLILTQKGLPTEIPDPLPANLSRHERARYRQAESIRRAGLWRQDLLHRPRHDPVRAAYSEQFTAEILAAVIDELEVRLSCGRELAAAYLDVYTSDGIPGISDRICGISPEQTSRTFIMERIRIALAAHLGWLGQDDLREVERLLICLQEGIYALQLPIALFPIVDTFPENDCRRHFRNWLRTEPALISQFAARARLKEEDGSARLHALSSYGGLGLLRLRQERLYRIIPRPIVHYVHFLKLAHINEYLDQIVVWDLVNEIAETLGVAALSPQVTRGLFNRLKKDGNWNTGSGDSTDPLFKQPSPYLPKAPRLFRASVLVPFSLDLPVLDEATSQIHKQCHGVLVLDHDGVLPMGCWICDHTVGLTELGLALYQSTWHVGNVWWPVRGVPDTILLPMKSLGLDKESLTNVHRAAHFMMAEVEANDREAYWRKQRIVQQFCEELPREVHQRITQGYATCSQVQSIALSWLYRVPLERALEWRSRKAKQDSRLEIDSEAVSTMAQAQVTDDARLEAPSLKAQRTSQLPSTLWSRGFAMPGYDSPAAGWLLPRAPDIVEATTDGIRLGVNHYSNPFVRIPPGTRLSYRQFPRSYATIERAVFVEYEGHLYYFIRNTIR